MIAELPLSFREACHWALYVKAIAPNGLGDVEIPRGAPIEARLEAAKRIEPILKARKLLYPDG